MNATWACENDRTLNQILKGELGFQGYVMSDWGAHHSTLAAVAGLDVRCLCAHILLWTHCADRDDTQMSMPGDITFNSGTSWWGANLTAFVENGTIANTRVDDMAERIIAAWYLLGQDENYPDGGFSYFCLPLARFPRYTLLTLATHSELQRVLPERPGHKRACGRTR